MGQKTRTIEGVRQYPGNRFSIQRTLDDISIWFHGRLSVNVQALIYALSIVLLWRLIASTVMYLAATYFPVDPLPANPAFIPQYTALKNSGLFEQKYLLPWLRWDTSYYLSIAAQGYSNAGQTVWPPLYPMLIVLLHSLGLHPLHAAMVISSLSSVFAFYSLYMLVEEEKFCPPRLVLLYLATFPVAFYFFSAYSEALFLAFSVACFREARKGNLLSAGIFSALATLTRQIGLLLTIPLLLEGFRVFDVHFRPFSLRRLISAICYSLCPSLAFLGFSLYVYFWLGYGFLWNRMNVHGHWFISFPGWVLVQSILDGFSGKYVWYVTGVLDWILSLVVIVLIIQGFAQKKRLPLSYLAYAAASTLTILMIVMENKLLCSISRYYLVVFPIFILQARLWNGKTFRMIWIASSFAINILLLTGFYAGFWIE